MEVLYQLSYDGINAERVYVGSAADNKVYHAEKADGTLSPQPS